MVLVSSAVHVWQWRESRRIEAEAHARFTQERDRSNEFHAHYMTAEAFSKLEQSELQAKVKSLKDATASSPLLQALAEDFRSKSEGYMIEIAKKFAGTPDEAFGRERALWHAARLEACGLLPPDMTAQFYVEGTFKAAKK